MGHTKGKRKNNVLSQISVLTLLNILHVFFRWMRMCAVTFIMQYRNMAVTSVGKGKNKKEKKGISWKDLDDVYSQVLEALHMSDLEVI
mgnify:CR=1 FL=1